MQLLASGSRCWKRIHGQLLHFKVDNADRQEPIVLAQDKADLHALF